MVGQQEAYPKISVVCPTYNSSTFVLDTLNTVLYQTLFPFELIVVDDGSTDDSCEKISAFIAAHPALHGQLIFSEHKGPGAARNKGILAATGDWIAFLDSDDQWQTEKLKKVTEAILNFPKNNFVCHNEEHVFLDGKKKLLNYAALYQNNLSLSKQLYSRNFFSPSAIVCKKELLVQVDLFNEKLMSSQDFELWLRMSPFIDVTFINDSLGFYIDRKGNISSKKHWMRWMNLMKIYFRHKDKANYVLFFKQASKISIAFLLNALSQYREKQCVE